MKNFTGKNIWIIGASSGIGESLAHELHAQGATLILSARREEELNALNKSLGDKHIVKPIDVSNAENLAEDDVLSFSHNEKLYAVYRLKGKEVHASDGHCTHRNVSLAGGLVLDGCIECPMHNGRFEIKTGKAVKVPAIKNLKMYPARLEGGKVLVDLSSVEAQDIETAQPST